MIHDWTRAKGAWALGLALLLAAGLAACGGGSTPSTGPTASTATSATTPPPTAAKPSAKKPAPRASRRSGAVPRERPPTSVKRKAGRAAPFVVAGGDNSIPTYGAESSGSQRESATADLRTYLAARARGDWATACSHMGGTVRKQLALLGGSVKGGAKGCAAIYKALTSRVPASTRANPLVGSLTALRVNGKQAFALFYGRHHQQYAVPMVNEGGTWKVTQIDPIPYPVGSQPSTAR